MENDVTEMAASGISAAIRSFELIFDDFFLSLRGYLDYIGRLLVFWYYTIVSLLI